MKRVKKGKITASTENEHDRTFKFQLFIQSNSRINLILFQTVTALFSFIYCTLLKLLSFQFHSQVKIDISYPPHQLLTPHI